MARKKSGNTGPQGEGIEEIDGTRDEAQRRIHPYSHRKTTKRCGTEGKHTEREST